MITKKDKEKDTGYIDGIDRLRNSSAVYKGGKVHSSQNMASYTLDSIEQYRWRLMRRINLELILKLIKDMEEDRSRRSHGKPPKLKLPKGFKSKLSLGKKEMASSLEFEKSFKQRVKQELMQPKPETLDSPYDSSNQPRATVMKGVMESTKLWQEVTKKSLLNEGINYGFYDTITEAEVKDFKKKGDKLLKRMEYAIEKNDLGRFGKALDEYNGLMKSLSENLSQ